MNEPSSAPHPSCPPGQVGAAYAFSCPDRWRARASDFIGESRWRCSTRVRALTLGGGPLTVRRVVTYGEAIRWLKKIGGTWIAAKEPALPRIRPSVVVSVKSAKGAFVQRHALYDDTVEGWERELEVRRALVRACEDLKRALR